jgi:hypothetical protein
MIELTAESLSLVVWKYQKGLDWSLFTLLYVGDETCRQYPTLFRMLSDWHGIGATATRDAISS